MNATTSREAMLADIRRALGKEGKAASSKNQPSGLTSDSTAHLVAGIKRRSEERRGELIEQFETELTKVGGSFHRAATPESAFQALKEIASHWQAKTVVAFDAPLIQGVDLRKGLEAQDIRLVIDSDKDFIKIAAAADLGISGVDYALAETGTLVLVSRIGQARSISLLPPVHVALLRSEQVITGLNDLFPLLRSETKAEGEELSSAVTFITGPSRTADIELTLVVGVHGPQQLHVILIGG